MKAFIYLTIVVACITFFAHPGSAVEDNAASGKVVALRGEVSAVNAKGETRKLAIKSPIYVDDTITTGRRSRVQIIFKDKTIISLGTQTSAKIAEYSWVPEKNKAAINTKIKEGVFRVMGGAITKVAPEKFITQTPSATIGIRGSMFFGQVRGDKLSVVFQGGKGIEITNNAGTVAITKPGFGTHVVSAEKAPEPPVRFTETEMNSLNEGLASETGEAPPSEESSQAEDADNSLDTALPEEPEIPSEAEDPTIFHPPPTTTVPTPLPTSGLDHFSGTYIKDSGPPTAMEMTLNWQNKKFIGRLNNGLFAGTITDTGATNVEFMVSAGSGMSIEWLDEDTFSGNFTDTAFTNFAMTASGSVIDIYAQSVTGAWDMSITADYDATLSASTPTGTSTWQGFVLGVAEDMSAPNTNRRYFMSDNADDFTLNLDRDSGTLSGTVTLAEDKMAASNYLANVEIGGTGFSVLLDDEAFIAEAACSSNCVNIGASSFALKPEGNFLVVEKPANQIATYATWGYWELAYTDPNLSAEYYLHLPLSMWIAGERTPTAYIDNLITTSFIGQYIGGAQGTRIDGMGNATALTGGVTDLTLEFYGGTSNPVSGSITFNEVTLPVLPTANISNSGFTAGISPTGTINGAFYGPNAESIGGTFDATVSVDQYYGIFGGDLQ